MLWNYRVAISGMIMGSFIACWLPFFLLYVISPICPVCQVSDWCLSYLLSVLSVISPIWHVSFLSYICHTQTVIFPISHISHMSYLPSILFVISPICHICHISHMSYQTYLPSVPVCQRAPIGPFGTFGIVLTDITDNRTHEKGCFMKLHKKHKIFSHVVTWLQPEGVEGSPGPCVPATVFSTAFWLGYSNSAFNPVSSNVQYPSQNRRQQLLFLSLCSLILL